MNPYTSRRPLWPVQKGQDVTQPVTHYPPSRDTGVTKCCNKREKQLPIGDRKASDPALVTCKGTK